MAQTVKVRRVLAIGGPADGHYLELAEGIERMMVPMPLPGVPGMGSFNYIFCALDYGNIEFLVPEGSNIAHALRLLVANYGPSLPAQGGALWREITAVRAELKAAGHDWEHSTLAGLVDKAIDKERTKHRMALEEIADALEISTLDDGGLRKSDEDVLADLAEEARRLENLEESESEATPSEETAWVRAQLNAIKGTLHKVETRLANLERNSIMDARLARDVARRL